MYNTADHHDKITMGKLKQAYVFLNECRQCPSYNVCKHITYLDNWDYCDIYYYKVFWL